MFRQPHDFASIAEEEFDFDETDLVIPPSTQPRPIRSSSPTTLATSDEQMPGEWMMEQCIYFVFHDRAVGIRIHIILFLSLPHPRFGFALPSRLNVSATVMICPMSMYD